MRRPEFLGFVGGAAAAWPLVASAQQAGKPLTIGYLARIRKRDILPTLWARDIEP